MSNELSETENLQLLKKNIKNDNKVINIKNCMSICKIF